MYDPLNPDEIQFKESFYQQQVDLVLNHPIVYKYINFESGMKILSDHTLAFRCPLEVNDPFDCNLSLIDFEKVPRSFIENLINKYPTYFDETTKKKLLTEPLEDTYARVRDAINIGMQGDLSKRGMSCFSETFSNLLMWSHYGNSHSGICIGFNLANLYGSIRSSSHPERFMAKVKYSKDFVAKDHYQHRWESIVDWLRTKSIDWEYEKEIRIVLYDLVFKDKLHIKPIDKDSIVSVFLGSKILKENEGELRATVAKQLPNVIIKKMTQIKNKFEVIPI